MIDCVFRIYCFPVSWSINGPCVSKHGTRWVFGCMWGKHRKKEVLLSEQVAHEDGDYYWSIVRNGKQDAGFENLRKSDKLNLCHAVEIV